MQNLIVLSLISTTLCSKVTRPIVQTNYGKIRGHTQTSYDGREYYAFNGVPYARPPVGHLRFRAPVSPLKYEGILDGSVDGPDCYQIDLQYNQYTGQIFNNGTSKYVGDEDCLYLNIYTPKLTGNKLPVMVFIHGGAFKVGSGAFVLQGPQFFMDQDIILVTINYRLEILGFLRADDIHLPGNYGLKDQSAALRWIKENIHHFNGDPDSITIFGESAGGASVNFQLLAPRNKGVFHRAISQSGFVHNPWTLQPINKAKEYAELLASILSCPCEPMLMLECLQEKSLLEIYQAYSTFESEFPYYMIFKPVIENQVPGAFLTQKSFDEGSDIPWIIGITTGEGIMYLEERLLIGDTDLSILNKNYEELLPKLMYLETCPQSKAVSKQIKQFYLGNAEFSMENAKQIVQLFSDGLFNYGFYKAGKHHRGKIYKYLFSYEGNNTFAPNFRHQNLGVNHGDDLLLQFYSTLYISDGKLNEADTKVSKHFIQLWTNFAKYGVPTPIESEINWLESSQSSHYLEISEVLQMKTDLYKDKFDFWDGLTNSYCLRKRDEL